MSAQEHGLYGRRFFWRAGAVAAGATTGVIASGESPGGLWIPQTEVSPSSETRPTIDMLEFLVPNQADRVRLNGSHKVTTVVEQNGMKIRKFGSTEHFEWLTWDDKNIYHMLDRSPQRTYSLRMRWAKRHMSVGEEIEEEGEIEWFDKKCNSVKMEPYRYKNQLIAHQMMDFRGNVGMQEAAVLQYFPFAQNGNPGNPEWFYYTRDHGWVMWEERSPELKLLNRSLFNQVEPLTQPPQAPPAEITCFPSTRRRTA